MMTTHYNCSGASTKCEGFNCPHAAKDHKCETPGLSMCSAIGRKVSCAPAGQAITEAPLVKAPAPLLL